MILWRILMEQIDYKTIEGIDKEIGTPFYFLDADTYKKNVSEFNDSFANKYNRIIIGYSFKTNYVPALCLIAKEMGCYAEVVSELELDLAISLNFKNIIFNGPIKKEKALRKAIQHNAIINLDSEYEVDFICKIKEELSNSNIRVGLRINISLKDEYGNSTIQCGLRSGRFGFPDDIIQRNIEKLRSKNISIISLHGHTSSSDRAVANYGIIAQRMLDVCKKHNLNNIQYFDVGGGFFGAAAQGINTEGKPKYDDYANIILDTILADEWFVTHQPNIVIEPGSSVVSNVFSYITKVYQNKYIDDKHFVIVDGSVFDVKPTMHSYNLPFTVYKSKATSEKCRCDIVGSTCMEKDIIMKDVEMENVDHGDYIAIRGVGAYTISLTPTFINPLAPILTKKGTNFDIVRRRQTVEDVLSIYKY